MKRDIANPAARQKLAINVPVIYPPALPACMGGWCPVRDRCAQHLTMSRRVVVERLCERGNERPRGVR